MFSRVCSYVYVCMSYQLESITAFTNKVNEYCNTCMYICHTHSCAFIPNGEAKQLKLRQNNIAMCNYK